MNRRPSKNKLFASGIAGVVLSLAVGAPAMAAPGDEVAFADDKLRSCVNNEIGQAPDSIVTEAQAGSITYLSCGSQGIESLAGAEHLTSLRYAHFTDNSISDATPFADLDELLHVSLAQNPISSTAGLEGHSKLARIFLYNTEVDDISGLKDLPSLFGLYLGNTGLSDLTPLAGLPSLQQFAADDSKISSLSGVESLPNLSQLVLNGNHISDLTPLAGATAMQQLLLNDNTISDVTPLSGLTTMWQLELSNNHISNVSGLAGLSALEDLYVDGQTVGLPDITVGEPQANPIVSSDGTGVTPSSTTATVDAAANSWTYTAAGTNELTWETELNIGAASGPFSGTITQSSVAAPVGPTDPTDPIVPTDPVDPAAPVTPETPQPGDNNTTANEVTPVAAQSLAQTGSPDLSWIAFTSALIVLVGGGLVAARLTRRNTEA
ncbi:hypothetical protein G7068_02420 [Leucobacter viscericola]|uniref:Uncharacterized protein n=1 Tax=Leucobacter viscericola TaxID=2714935 RepID=A0A6G7XC47_9MICO|nr:hypothetical protein [Leucobacter viscericola]QIK62180.1 hypothetical protein G7068_02420 [Leucobacter viscericola]